MHTVDNDLPHKKRSAEIYEVSRDRFHLMHSDPLNVAHVHVFEPSTYVAAVCHSRIYIYIYRERERDIYMTMYIKRIVVMFTAAV